MTRRWLAPVLALLFSASLAWAGPSIVFDPKTGEVILHERAGEPWYPASLTKLMTAYVVFHKLRKGELKLDQRVPVSATAAKQPPSKLGTPEGKSISVDLALQSLLVYSANDMAVVLAEAAGGTTQYFVREMNANARRLGMTGSHFANPNGLFDERQVVTARDLALLATALIQEFPEYQRYFEQPYVTIGNRKLLNRNSLLRQMKEADGMKTGFVCNSGFNLIGSATHNGRRLVAITLGSTSPQKRADLVQQMLEASFGQKGPGSKDFVTSIPNARLGALVPADMTATVCKNKNPVVFARGTDLGGWGFSLGSYESAQLANMALRGRLLGAREMLEGGSSGVIKLPMQKNGFVAMMWDMDEVSSRRVCAAFVADKIYCDVMSPESFAKVGALIAEKPPQTVNGDATTPAKKKPKKKTRRKKSR